MTTRPNPVSPYSPTPHLLTPSTHPLCAMSLTKFHPYQATLVLTVSYPPSYPDTPPDLDISLPSNTPKHAHFDLSISKPILLSSLPPLIADSLGSAMIFTLVSHIKDFAEQLVLDSIAAEQDVADAEKRKAEEEEDKKFSGRRVTRESFGEWRVAFRKEAREREEEEVRRREEGEMGQGKKRGVKEDKLTGRELWERGLVGKIEEDEEGLHAVAEGVGGLKVGGV